MSAVRDQAGCQIGTRIRTKEEIVAVGRGDTSFSVALVGVIALVVNACGGAVPGTNAVADGVPGASGAPAGPASVTGSGGPAEAGVAAGSRNPRDGDVTLVAEDSNFTPSEVSTPAGKALNILFQNKDPNVFHDVDIMNEDGSSIIFDGQLVYGPKDVTYDVDIMNGDGSKIIFDGKLVYGPKDVTYDVPALPAGTYEFKCSVHPGQMTGTLTVR